MKEDKIKIIVTKMYKRKPSKIRLEWIDGTFLCELDNKMALNLASQLLNIQKISRIR